MQLVFTQATTLNPDGTKIQVGHEPDGELVQYFLSSDRVRNSSYKVVLGNYSAVSFVAIPNRIPSRNYVRFGIKTFPKIGAYGWFRSKYENLTHILVPLRNIPVKYDPPTFSFTQTATINISIAPPNTVTYECYRIIFRDAYYSYEVITYDITVAVEKPRNGTYELYIIGYRSTGETSEETPRQNIVITGGAPTLYDRVASIAANTEEPLTGNVKLIAGNDVTMTQDDESNTITIDYSGEAFIPIVVPKTLLATGWSSKQYTLNDSNIRATSTGDLRISQDATDTQYNSWGTALIRIIEQGAGYVILKAVGDAPIVDIQVELEIRT